MKMKAEAMKNLNFHGSVNIIAAFPTIGKTTLASMFTDDSVVVIDHGSEQFRETLTTEAKDSWVEYYADSVVDLFREWSRSIAATSRYAGSTVFILVSSSDKVRRALNERHLEYYHVIPSKELATLRRDDSRKRTEEFDKVYDGYTTPANERNRLEAQFYSAGGIDLINDALEHTEELEYERLITLDPLDNRETAYLSNLVLDHTTLPNDYRYPNAVALDAYAAALAKLMTESRTRVFLTPDGDLIQVLPHSDQVTEGIKTRLETAGINRIYGAGSAYLDADGLWDSVVIPRTVLEQALVYVQHEANSDLEAAIEHALGRTIDPLRAQIASL